MKFKSLVKLLVVMLVATIPGVIATAPSSAIGTTTYTSPQWNKILKEANGQTVNWYMWGGGAKINTYVNDYIGAEAKKLGVTLNQVKLNATPEAVNKVLGEKQAGKNTDGAVDMIWINGENFAAMKRDALLSATRAFVVALWVLELRAQPANVAARFFSSASARPLNFFVTLPSSKSRTPGRMVTARVWG